MDRGVWRATVHGMEKSQREATKQQLTYLLLIIIWDREAWRAAVHGAAKNRTHPSGRTTKVR